MIVNYFKFTIVDIISRVNSKIWVIHELLEIHFNWRFFLLPSISIHCYKFFFERSIFKCIVFADFSYKPTSRCSKCVNALDKEKNIFFFVDEWVLALCLNVFIIYLSLFGNKILKSWTRDLPYGFQQFVLFKYWSIDFIKWHSLFIFNMKFNGNKK